MAAYLLKNHVFSGALALAASSGLLVGQLIAEPFNAVEIKGAQFIPREDIALACDVLPDLDYSADDMREVEDCLMSSGQFRSVSVAGEGETLVVSVEELNDRPGRLEVGLAYDSRDGATATLYFERYNLFPGTFGSVDLKFSEEVAALQTSLYLADAFEGFDFGIDTQLRRTEYEDQGFTSKRALIEPYLAYQFAGEFRAEVGLGYRLDEMKDPVAGSSALFTAEAGSVEAPYLRIGLRYSTDNATDTADRSGPLTGLVLSFDQYFWGLGTDQRTAETRVALDARLALSDRSSLLFGLQGGIVSAEGGHKTRAVDRFFIGGADFRGFAPRGLGPKDGSSFVGANKFFVTSLELQHEVDEIFGTSAKVGIFADVGSAWDLDDTLGGSIDDSRQIRSSVGLSLTLDVGSIPVSIFVARPVDSRPGDDKQAFGISFSTSF